MTALLGAAEAIEPGLTTTPLASNDPTDFTSLFAAIDPAPPGGLIWRVS